MAALDQARQSLGQVAALRAEVDSWRTQNAVLKELNGSLETDNGLLFDAFNEELDAMYDDVHQEDGSAMQRMVKDLQASKKSKMALAKELAYVVVSSVAWSELTRDPRETRRQLALVTSQRDASEAAKSRLLRVVSGRA